MGEYLIVSDFRRGLDVRKFALGAPAGTLVECNDGHLTQAGDIEKRKGFPRFGNSGGATVGDFGEEGDQATAGAATFGLQATALGLTLFGSALPNGSDPGVTAQPTLIGIYPYSGVSPTIYYQQLQHPAVSEGTTYDKTKHRMTALVRSELFGGLIAAVAQFADGRRFLYYDGDLVEDCASGLVLPHRAGDNVKLAQHLARLLELTTTFAGEQSSYASESYSWSGGTVSVTVTGHGRTVGESNLKATASGVAGWEATAVTLTVLDANTFTYPLAADPGAGGTTGLTLTLNVVEVTGPDGVEFTVAATATSSAGTFATPVAGSEPVAPKTGTPAVGSFKIMGGSADGSANEITQVTVGQTDLTAATQRLIIPAASNFANGEKVTLNGTEYEFITPWAAADGKVLIGADALTSLVRLFRAINDAGLGEGTLWQVAAAHPTILAASVTSETIGGVAHIVLTVRARTAGLAGNSLTVADTSTAASWEGSQLSGGVGTVTDLLPTPIYFTEDNAATVAAVVEAINGYSEISGYTAAVGEETNRVLIYSAADLDPMPNGYRVSVSAGGNVCVDDCVLSFGVEDAGTASVTKILVDGVDILDGTPVAFADTLANLYAALATQINSATETTGYLAFAAENYIRLSRAAVASDDALELAVDVVETGLTVSFEAPAEETDSDLAVSVPDQVFETTSTQSAQIAGVQVVTATPTGGSGAYPAFVWEPEIPGGELTGGTSDAPSNVAIVPSTPNFQATRFVIVKTSGQARPIAAGNYAVRYVCVVTDGYGNTARSNPVTVRFLVAAPA